MTDEEFEELRIIEVLTNGKRKFLAQRFPTVYRSMIDPAYNKDKPKDSVIQKVRERIAQLKKERI